MLDEIRRLEALSRAAALYRSRPTAESSVDLVGWLKDLISVGDDRLGSWARADR